MPKAVNLECQRVSGLSNLLWVSDGTFATDLTTTAKLIKSLLYLHKKQQLCYIFLSGFSLRGEVAKYVKLVNL